MVSASYWISPTGQAFVCGDNNHTGWVDAMFHLSEEPETFYQRKLWESSDYPAVKAWKDMYVGEGLYNGRDFLTVEDLLSRGWIRVGQSSMGYNNAFYAQTGGSLQDAMPSIAEFLVSVGAPERMSLSLDSGSGSVQTTVGEFLIHSSKKVIADNAKLERAIHASLSKKAFWAPPQDRSLPTLKRALELGYDRFTWHTNARPDQDEMCLSMDGYDGTIDELLGNLAHNAPIYETTHVGCLCELELYSTTNPELMRRPIRAKKVLGARIQEYESDHTMSVGVSSYTWDSMMSEADELLRKRIEVDFDVTPTDSDMVVVYPGGHRGKWLNAIVTLALNYLGGVALDDVTDDQVFQALSEVVRQWYYKRMEGKDARLEDTTSSAWYFGRRHSEDPLGL